MRRIPTPLSAIGFNKRTLTFQDFELLCADLGVKVFFAEMESEGLHFCRRGYRIIVLNSRLTGMLLLYVAWHEYAHCLLHSPAVRYFAPGSIDKIEREANDIALCCLIPRCELKRILLGQVDDWLYPKDMMQRRCELFTQHGL